MSTLPISESADAITFDVQVVPRASKERLGPVLGDRLKIQLTAPPVDGAANEALVTLLARKLGARRNQNPHHPRPDRSQEDRARRGRHARRAPLAARGHMNRILIASAFLVSLAACGGKSGTLSLDIVVSPTDDPFADAASVRFTIGDSTNVDTETVTAGHFNLSVKQKPESTDGPVLVEALDAGGNVIAHGVTPSLQLSAMDQGPIAVWVGRPGKVATTSAAISVLTTLADGSQAATPAPRTDMASTSVTGLGVLFCGGRDINGNALPTTAVYDVFTQAIINTSDMETARAGGLAGASTSVQAWAYGGAQSIGIGTTGTPQSTIELFDPTTGLGVWAPLPTDAFTARSFPNGAVLASGDTLITGGLDGNGMPLNTGGLVNPSGAIRLTALATPMAAARSGHAVAAAHFSDGDGAILFGGLAAGSTLPVAERLVGQTFAAYSLGVTLPNLVDATATTMPNGDVLILGGQHDDGTVSQGGIVISPGVTPPTVTQLPTALSVARVGHSATISGSVLVVCGGADGTGTAQGSCDILDTSSYAIQATVPLATPRRNHVSQLLETGDIVIAGGLGSDGKPTASIELFTHE